jgi:hypothetical protein
MYNYKNITATQEQAQWIAEHHINLSRLVQDTPSQLLKETQVIDTCPLT